MVKLLECIDLQHDADRPVLHLLAPGPEQPPIGLLTRSRARRDDLGPPGGRMAMEVFDQPSLQRVDLLAAIAVDQSVSVDSAPPADALVGAVLSIEHREKLPPLAVGEAFQIGRAARVVPVVKNARVQCPCVLNIK